MKEENKNNREMIYQGGKNHSYFRAKCPISGFFDLKYINES